MKFLYLLLFLLTSCEQTIDTKPDVEILAQEKETKTVERVEKEVEKEIEKEIEKTKTIKKVKKVKKVKKIEETIVEKDLWQYISKRHSLKARSEKDLFWHIDWFKKNPGYLTRVTKRAEPYLYLITKEVERVGVPIEIALLPIVESAYYPFSFSHGTASGLWQFIPSTGKLYGLKQNYWADDRRNVIKSTKAAISYLKSLNKLFKGDWLLAIAAYNSGPGRVQKAIAKNKKAGRKADFWNLKLPNETKGYVPRLLAVSELIKNYDKYGQKIAPITNEPKVKKVFLDGQLDLALIAEWTGISLDKIYELNPDINRWATPNVKNYELLLPIDKVAIFKKSLASYPKQKRLTYKRYKIKSGDSLNVLASKFNTSKDYIKSINHLKNDKIIAGKIITIPIAQQKDDYYSLSKEQREKQRMGLKKNGVKIIHTVKKGDSLWKISRKYDVNINNIIRWNHLQNAKRSLQVGKDLVLWQVQEPKANELKKLAGIGIDIDRKISYKIRKGDNLSVIASKFGTSIESIVATNNLDKNKPLKIGNKLKIIKPIVNK